MNKNLNEIPDEFKKIVKDFVTDILNTFPEYKDKFTENELEYLKKDKNNEKLKISFDYFKSVYPERFFDILYENEELFTDNTKNTKFFENIEFKDIWKENISENTKNIIWKYLQLMLFSLSKNIDGTDTFGDTAKMFEAINEDVLKNKLEEVISSMSDVFDISNNNKFEEMMKNMAGMSNMTPNMAGMPNMMPNMAQNTDGMASMFEEMMKNMDVSGMPNMAQNTDGMASMFEEMMKNMDVSGMPNMAQNTDGMASMFEEMMKNMDVSGMPNMTPNTDGMANMFEEMMKNMKGNMKGNVDVSGIPNPEDIQNHLNSLMGGKIGKLAKEIADETASELDIDTNNINGVGDIFSKLFKNPGQLMSMIKKVSSKLDQKLKSGEIKEAELMKEANDLVEKMKNTPGMKDMEKMLGKMGMGGKGGKVNMNMFQSMMKSNIKKSSQKERMLNKLNQRKQERDIMEKIKKIKEAQRQPSQKDMQDYDEYIQKIFKVDEKKIKKSKIKKKKKKKKKGKK